MSEGAETNAYKVQAFWAHLFDKSLAAGIIMFGLASWAGWIPSPIAKADQIRLVETKIASMEGRIDILIRVARQICRNVAETPAEKQDCNN